MPGKIVFDVNETLLDLSALDGIFARIFGTAAVKREWFMQVIQSAVIFTLLNRYVDFGTVGRHALKMTAQRHGIALTEKDISEIAQGMRRLPPHPEVPEALELLKKAGFKLAALSNSGSEMMKEQLTNAGILGYFKRVISVEMVRCFKPAKAVYDMAVSELSDYPDNMMLVAAHEWDISGAISAGWSGAFVARPGMVLGPLSEKPDIIGRNLLEVAQKIIENENQ